MLHGRSLLDALGKATKVGLLDQFSKQPLVQKYVKDNSFDLQMRTKAEEDPVVAAASIIARATWLEQMKKLEDLAGRSLPKGSGVQAKQAAIELYRQLGESGCLNSARCISRLPTRQWAKLPLLRKHGNQTVKELMPNPRWTHDRKLCRDFLGMVGVDGRQGMLAGPVVAGCVVLPSEFFSQTNNRRIVEKINDSKQFDEATREELFGHIHSLIDNGKLIGATGSAVSLRSKSITLLGLPVWQCKERWNLLRKEAVGYGHLCSKEKKTYLIRLSKFKQNGRYWWMEDR